MSLTNTIRAHLPITAIGWAALIAGLMLTLPAAAGAGTRTTTVTVTAGKPSEFGFVLSTKTFKHGPVTFKVTNGGQIPRRKVRAKPRENSTFRTGSGATPLIGPQASGSRTRSEAGLTSMVSMAGRGNGSPAR